MRLWLIIYVAGKIGGTFGPLPYGHDECLDRARILRGDLNPSITTTQGYTARDIRFECEWHTRPPSIDPSAGQPR